MKAIFNFAVKGVKAFREASFGKFNEESGEVKQLKDEMMNHPSNIATDRKNLRDDQRSVYHDIRKSYYRIATGNV